MRDRPQAAATDPLLARALELCEDVAEFRSRWAPLPADEACFTFRWAELERQLVDLAPTELQAELVHRLIARTRTFAELKPTEMVLRELLCVAALVLGESSLEVRGDD